MSRLFRFLILPVLALVPLIAGAQAVVGEIRFVPPEFYVGDRVEMTVDLSVEKEVNLTVPEELPESDWIEIADVRVETDRNKISVTIVFIPFAPGTRTLPEIDLGGLYVKDLKVPTRTVLSDDVGGLRTLRGQLLLPGTRVALALILALAAMAPFLGFSGLRWIWRQFRNIQEAWQVGRPARKLRRILKNLAASIGSTAASAWYSVLTEAMRTYMTAKLGRDCMSATTAEIARMEEFSSAEDAPSMFLEILQEGDMVKFAGRFADDRSLKKTLGTVDSAIGQWEKRRDQLQ